MKRVFLVVMVLICLNVSSVFSRYSAEEGSIDVILDQNLLGFSTTGIGASFGTEKFRGIAGINFNGIPNFYNNGRENDTTEFFPGQSVSVGFGYVGTGIASFGIVYEFGLSSAEEKNWMFNGIDFGFTLWDNQLRLSLPVFVGTYLNNDGPKFMMEGTRVDNATSISVPLAFRYYSRNEADWAFTQVRLYGTYSTAMADVGGQDFTASSIDLQLRLYFSYPSPENLTIGYQVRGYYASSFGNKLGDQKLSSSETSFTSRDGSVFGADNRYISETGNTQNAYSAQFRYIPIYFSAGNDIISAWIQPHIAYVIEAPVDKSAVAVDSIEYGIYTEISLYPMPDLEIYLESGGYGGSDMKTAAVDYTLEAYVEFNWYY